MPLLAAADSFVLHPPIPRPPAEQHLARRTLRLGLKVFSWGCDGREDRVMEGGPNTVVVGEPGDEEDDSNIVLGGGFKRAELKGGEVVEHRVVIEEVVTGFFVVEDRFFGRTLVGVHAHDAEGGGAAGSTALMVGVDERGHMAAE